MVSTSLIMVLLCSLLISFVLGKAEFGPFEVTIHTIRQCHGPKRKNCCKININTINNRALYDFQVIENASVTKAKITIEGNNKTPVRLQMDKPCEHLFVKPIMKLYFNMSENCIVYKGNYHVVYDFEEQITTYYQGMFIYGNWTFKSMMFGDNCNFLCTEIDVELYPKKKINKFS